MRVRKLLSVSITLLLVAIAVGCAPEPPPTPDIVIAPTPTITPAPTPTQPYVPQSITLDPRQQVVLRFVHAAAGYDALDVYAERLTLASRLVYGTSTSGAQIVGGDYVISVFPSGASPDDEPALRAPLALEGGSRYTMLLTNEGGTLRLAAIPDDLSPLMPGQSRILIIHASPALSAVDIGLRGETALINDLAFAQSTPSLTLPSGRLTLQARPDGQNPIEYAANLREGYGYILILQGDRARWVEFADSLPGEAVARVINAMDADVGAIDVYLDGMLAGSALAFGAGSDPITIAAETSTLRVLTAGAAPDSQALVEAAVTANNGDSIAFVVVGDATSGRVISAIDSAAPLNPDRARITFLNVYPDAPQMRDNGEGVITQPVTLAYGSAPLTLEILPGSQRFYWRPGIDQQREEELFDPRDFAAGTSYLYILTGREDAPALVFERQVAPPTTTAAPSDFGVVRWVNVIESAALTFTLDDSPHVSSLAYTQQSVTEITAENHLISVISGTSRSQETLLEVRAFAQYSVFAYGSPQDPQILVIENERFSAREGAARVRLAHVAPVPGQRTLSMAYSPAAADFVNTAFAATPSVGGATSLPFGANTLVRRTPAGGVSLSAQLSAGRYDFFVLDDSANGVISTIPSVELLSGTAYEIVAVQSLFGQEITVIMLQVVSGS
jgi:hypothetical protein